MPLIKIPFKPGINREIPEYANEGGYDFSNLIRFRMGYAEKLGGWANTSVGYTFNGITRSIHNWVTLLKQNLLGFGTTQEFYAQEGIASIYHDIAPSAYTTTLNGASFSSVEVGSRVVEVSNVIGSIMTPTPNDGLDVGSIVYFYSPNLGGRLLLESSTGSVSNYLTQEPFTPSYNNPPPNRFLIGVAQTFQVGGIEISAEYDRNDSLATPYEVISVDRQIYEDCIANANATTVTLTTTSFTGVYPKVGAWILVTKLDNDSYNGTYQVLTVNYVGTPDYTITITYANTSGVSGVGTNGRIYWVNSFRFLGNTPATSIASGNGSLDLATYYLPNFGNSTTKYLTSGDYPITKRVWSQASFGEDLIMAIQGNPIYYWTKDTTNWAPAVTLADYADTQQYQQVSVTNNAANTTTFYADFNDYINIGQVISVASGSYGTVPAGTKIVSITGLEVTVSNPISIYNGTGNIASGTASGTGTNGVYTNIALTGGSGSGAEVTITISSGIVSSATITNPGTGYTSGDNLSYSGGGISSFTYSVLVAVTEPTLLNLSYSGRFVPTQTNKIFISNVYQFAIALGANPYNPFDPNTEYDPLLVRWSDQSNPYEWVPSTSNQSGEQSLGNGSKLVTAVPNLQVILVFTDTAIYQMQYVGPPYVFSFTLLQENISIVSQNAAITANNVTWWMGSDKFYMFNGSVQTLPCPIRRYIFSNLNKEQAWQIVVGYNEGFSEIWWFYPSASSTINDSYVKYNFVDNVWDYGSLNRTAWNGSTTYDYPMAAHSVQNTYLTAAVTTSSNSLSVADTSSFHTSGVLLVDNEQIIYTGKTATSFTGLTRPSPVAHDKYAAVKLLVPNQLMFHEYGIDDNTIPDVTIPIQSFIQSSDIGLAEGNDLVSVGRIIPDLTFTNSTQGTTPVITTTIYPRLNPGSNYQMNVDTPTITAVNVPENEATAFPPEQYTGQPSSRALLVAGQGQIYTRVRGRTIAFRVDTGDLSTYVTIPGYPIQVPANSLGNMWQLGLMRFDIRKDGKR